MRLIGLDVHNKDKSVVFLDLLHGALCIERMDDDLVLVQSRNMRNRLPQVLRRSRNLQGLWAVEAGCVPDLGLLERMRLEEMSIFGPSTM
jgi:hypothetical protein